jgi:hypothetical protein
MGLDWMALSGVHSEREVEVASALEARPTTPSRNCGDQRLNSRRLHPHGDGPHPRSSRFW